MNRATTAIVICSAVSWWAVTSAAAECGGLVGTGPISAGDIFALGHRAIDARVLQGDDTLSARGQLRLAFVVAANSFRSGALIVKSQNADGNGTPIGSPDFVFLKRDRHITSCTNNDKDRYSHTVPLAKFVNYHFYFADDYSATDDNLENFHTEVGIRSRPSWLGSKDSCLKTNDRIIRPQFMFDERRRAPSYSERALRIVSDTSRSLDGERAEAKPAPAVAAYSAQIVPFQRSLSGLSCVLATIDVPARAALTTVSVVDVDDAAAGIMTDPQHSRTITWQAVQPRVHAIRRH